MALAFQEKINSNKYYIQQKSKNNRKNEIMKKMMISFIAVVVSCMFLTGCGSDVDAVKGGTLGDYKSLTIGDAFDNYSHFKSSSWEKFETKNKQRVVQFNGEMEIPQKYKDRNFSKMVMVIQFIINNDNTFRVAYVQLEYVKKGKKKSDNMSAFANNIIAAIYADRPINSSVVSYF